MKSIEKKNLYQHFYNAFVFAVNKNKKKKSTQNKNEFLLKIKRRYM